MPTGASTSQRPTVGFAFETLTVSNSAKVMTASTYAPNGQAPSEKAFVTCEAGELRYRYDGTAPTATVGHKLTDGAFIILNGIHQIQKFSCIRSGSVDATLAVTYERE